MPRTKHSRIRFRKFAFRLFFLFCFCLVFSWITYADSIVVGLTGSTHGSGGFFIGSVPGGTVWQGFSFTLSRTYSDVSITPTFEVPKGTADITTWLTTSAGPQSTPSSVIGSSTLDLTGSGTNVFLSGLTLASGTYDVLFSQSSGSAFWGILSPPTVQLGAGVVLGDQLSCVRGCVNGALPPASSWVDMGSAPVSPVVISGTPVPEPSTLVLLLAGIIGVVVATAGHKKSGA